MKTRIRNTPIEATEDQETRGETDSFDVIQEPELRDLAAYWSAKRDGGAFPTRDAIDPVDIPWALNRIYIADRAGPEVGWRYVLAGDLIEQALRRNSLRGVGLNELLPREAFQSVCRRWHPVSEGRAIYMRGQIYKAAERYVWGARLLLPLSDNGAAVTGLIGMSLSADGAPTSDEPSLTLWSIGLNDP
jgi:hypothetical protein